MQKPILCSFGPNLSGHMALFNSWHSGWHLTVKCGHCNSRFNNTANMLWGLMELNEHFEVLGPFGDSKLIVTGLVLVLLTALG